MASVKVTVVASQTVVASAEKSASKATKEAQSSKKMVCASIFPLPTVQLAVDQAASSTDIQFRSGLYPASKKVKL